MADYFSHEENPPNIILVAFFLNLGLDLGRWVGTGCGWVYRVCIQSAPTWATCRPIAPLSRSAKICSILWVDIQRDGKEPGILFYWAAVAFWCRSKSPLSIADGVPSLHAAQNNIDQHSPRRPTQSVNHTLAHFSWKNNFHTIIKAVAQLLLQSEKGLHILKIIKAVAQFFVPWWTSWWGVSNIRAARKTESAARVVNATGANLPKSDFSDRARRKPFSYLGRARKCPSIPFCTVHLGNLNYRMKMASRSPGFLGNETRLHCIQIS